MLQSAPQRLADGSAVVVTVARLLTSTGESFDTLGVVPDVEVLYEIQDERALINADFEIDPQISRSSELLRSTIGSTLQPAPESAASTTTESTVTVAPNDPGAPTSSESTSDSGGAPRSGESSSPEDENGQGEDGDDQGQDNNNQGGTP